MDSTYLYRFIGIDRGMGFLFSGVYALTARPLEVVNKRKIIDTIVNENRFYFSENVRNRSS